MLPRFLPPHLTGFAASHVCLARSSCGVEGGTLVGEMDIPGASTHLICQLDLASTHSPRPTQAPGSPLPGGVSSFLDRVNLLSIPVFWHASICQLLLSVLSLV